ncbi:MAG: AAA family ATPase [Phycisphaerales bacterium]
MLLAVLAYPAASAMDEATIKRALCRPGALPAATRDAPTGAAPVVVETHASIVLLTDERAWKLKKHVDLGFLDFRTIEARKRDCDEEVRLNRRFAPEIYLGVWPVVAKDGDVRVERSERPEGTIVDWAVEMRRLPADGMLDRVVAGGGPPAALIDEFAGAVARFHARAATGAGVDEYGRIERVAARMNDNLARLRQHAPLPAAFADRIAERLRARLDAIAPLLDARRLGGRVRELHGDLHCRNCCVLDGRIVAYDCLEFSVAYRCADVASEIAFLAMDLDARGRSDLAESFIDAYADASGDRGVRGVERFFRAHYAVIRAMVESIRLHDAALDASERDAVRATATNYALLAAGYLVQPALVVMTGLPATGKSTIARRLAAPLRATIVRTDEIRKRLAGVAPTEHGGRDLYDESHTRRTYDAVRAEVAATLAEGRTAIVDAANLLRWQRRAFLETADAARCPCVVVEATADESTVRERMRARSADRAEISDATWQVYEALRATREALDDVPRDRLVVLPSERGDAPDALVEVIHRLLAQPAAASLSPPA